MFDVTSEGILQLYGDVYADFEAKSVLNITVTVTDKLGKSFSKDFTINTVDIDYTNPHAIDQNISNWVVPKPGTIFDSLIWGFTLDPDYDFSTPLTITYSFINQDSVFYNGLPSLVDEVLTPTESFVNAVSEMFDLIGSILGINFLLIEETDSVVGDIRCGIYFADSNVAGFCDVGPALDLGNLARYFGDNGSSSSNLWFNTNSFDEDNITQGSFAYNLINHELGHALGLGHPFDNRVSPWLEYYLNLLPGSEQYVWETILGWHISPIPDYQALQDLYIGVFDSAPRIPDIFDWQAYTVMSYDDYPGENNEFIQSGMIVDSATGEYVYPGTFMSLDIFFLMYIYNYLSLIHI